jgi:hypothetical protein
MDITFRKTYSWIEDGFGPTVVYVVVSNTFAGLYSGAPVETNIMDIEGLQQSIKGKNGGFEETELKLVVYELAVESNDDLDFIQFIKETESVNARRIVGIFFDEISHENLMFHGTVKREIEAEDLVWHGQHFDQFPNPKRELRFRITPYRQSIFGAFTIEELVSNISPEWESSNVRTRMGYAYYPTHNSDVRVDSIVNLNDILRELANRLQEAIVNEFEDEVEIKFDPIELDGNWHPARWKKLTAYNIKTRYVVNPYPSNDPPFDIFSDDYISLKIDPDGKPEAFEIDEYGLPVNSESYDYMASSIYVSYRLFKYLGGNDRRDAAKQHSLYRIKNFFELIEIISLNFGLFARVYWSTNNQIRIGFTSRNENIGEIVYLKTVLAGKLQPSGDEITNNKYIGKANYKAVEGYDIYIKNLFTADVEIRPSDRIRTENLEGTEISLTISPTVVSMSDAREFSLTLRNVSMPENHVFYKNNSPETADWQETKGIHTALYLLCERRDEADSNEPARYFTPVGAMTLKDKNNDLTFYRLSDYLNYINGFDNQALYHEYSLILPGFYCLSGNSDGSEPSWKNLKLHNKMFLDNHWWKITRIDYNFGSKEIEIVLHSAEQYSFSNPLSPVIQPDTVSIGFTPQSEVFSRNIETVNLSAPVTRLEIVARKNDGTHVKALPIRQHYKCIVGIATVDGESGDYINIQSGGVISDESLPDYPINTKVFLRKNDEGINFSDIPLTIPNADEHVYVILGMYIGYKTLKLNDNFPQQWIFSKFK